MHKEARAYSRPVAVSTHLDFEKSRVDHLGFARKDVPGGAKAERTAGVKS